MILRTRTPGRAKSVLILLSIGSASALLLAYAGLAWSKRSEFAPRLGAWFWPSVLLSLCWGLASLRIGWTVFRQSRLGLRPEPGAGTLRLLFYLVVTGVAFAVWLGQPYHRLVALLSLAASFGLFVLLVRLREPLLRRLPARPLRIADFALLNLCLLLVFAELGLRGLARWRPSPLFARATADAEDWIRQYRARPGSIYYGFPYNSEGYYDEEFEPGTADRPVVVVIGDSFSVGVVPHSFHYTTVAERLLRGCSLQNRGVASIGPAEYLHILLNEALDQKPSAIVIGLFVSNDAQESFRFHEPPSLIRTWFDREYLLTATVARRLSILGREQRRALEAGGPAGFPQHVGQPLWSSREELLRELPWLVNPRLETPPFSEHAFLDIELRRALIVCSQNDRIYERLFLVLEEIQRVAGDVPLGVLLIPDEFQVEDALWQELVETGWTHGLLRDRPQREITAWLGRRGIPCLDLLPELRRAPALEDGRLHLYHLRDTHLNARGNELVGRLLAAFLAENGWADLK